MNKRHLLIRIITFPFKLLFSSSWYFCICIVSNIKWLLYGGEEVVFFKNETKGILLDIVEQNEKLLNLLNPKQDENN